MNEEYYVGAFCQHPGFEIRKFLNFNTGKNVKIGVVDSGWDKNLVDSRIKKGVCFVDPDDELSLKLSEIYDDQNGHGTSCTDLILRLAPDSSIYPIKVFGNQIETSVNILIEAIKWAIDEEIKILNFSLGTKITEALEPLYKACEFARRNGMIIISANTNLEDDYSYPAIFENSIGVEQSEFDSVFEIVYKDEEAIECQAKGRFTDILDLNNFRRFSAGNSFAAPVVTGLVSLYLENNPNANLEETREFLKNYYSFLQEKSKYFSLIF